MNLKKRSKQSIKATMAYVSLRPILFQTAAPIRHIKACGVLADESCKNFVFIVSVKEPVKRKESHV